MMGASRSCDVAVIGGGLAGLCAARRLAATGIEVLVLEAQDRVGGRTLTERCHEGTFIDHGGQWVSPGQDRIVALADELGIRLFPTWDQGLAIDWRGGIRRTYSGPFAPADMSVAPEVCKAATMLTDMAAQVPLESPWSAPQAGTWDEHTLDEWLVSHVQSPGARTILARSIQGVFTDGPGTISLLAALFWIRSGDPLVPFLSNADPGPERRFVGGAQQLSEHMARALGTRVILGARVSHIAYGPTGVHVSAETVTVSAQRAIIALAPAIAGRLRYTPALPATRDQLTQRTPMGWLIRVHAAYPARFWIQDGLSGQVTSDAGALRVCVDNSPASGSPGVLAGFIEGAEARRLAVVSSEERRAAVLDTSGRRPEDRTLITRRIGAMTSLLAVPKGDTGRRASGPPTVTLFVQRSGRSIGPGRKPLRSGTARWRGRYARGTCRSGGAGVIQRPHSMNNPGSRLSACSDSDS
jgi:monoamine oxidase